MMRITKQTATTLTIKSNKRLRLFIFGIFIFGLSLLTLILVRVQPLSQRDLQFSRLLYYQDESADSFNPDTQNTTVADTDFRLAYYTGRLLFTRERPLMVLALLGLTAGLVILISPFFHLYGALKHKFTVSRDNGIEC